MVTLDEETLYDSSGSEMSSDDEDKLEDDFEKLTEKVFSFKKTLRGMIPRQFCSPSFVLHLFASQDHMVRLALSSF